MASLEDGLTVAAMGVLLVALVVVVWAQEDE
jgi:hypothetical protein